ncbi:MAG: hypothetical protein IKL57_01050 [Oscillospiraceae bacterium]|nr:hypothetical protein [Oscillospiraceae bacterium]
MDILKTVSAPELLIRYANKFGKHGDYFKLAAVVEEMPEEKHGSATLEELEKAWHRAEVFERMAFKLQEERELLIWFLRKVCNGTWFCDCDGCANAEQFGACGDIDKSCRGCEREGTCPCGTCERGSNLVFDPERAKKLWEEDERRKKK